MQGVPPQIGRHNRIMVRGRVCHQYIANEEKRSGGRAGTDGLLSPERIATRAPIPLPILPCHYYIQAWWADSPYSRGERGVDVAEWALVVARPVSCLHPSFSVQCIGACPCPSSPPSDLW